ncbi:hypothetical protein [Candidatus Tisiphia endosymbiont of Hybos culiciformis]
MEDSDALKHDWEERYTNCHYTDRLLNSILAAKLHNSIKFFW